MAEITEEQQQESRQKAPKLFWMGYTVPEISKELNVPKTTVYSWKKRDNWNKATIAEKVETVTYQQIVRLINKSEQTDLSDRDIRTINTFGVLLERMAKVKKFEQQGNPKYLNHKLENAGRKSNKEKNYLSDEDIEKLEEAFNEMFMRYAYQYELVKKFYKYPILNILKSRQIGLTFFFALFAILHAFKTGENWIFLSASKNQAHLFKNYIIDFVRDVTKDDDTEYPGLELKGDPIRLANGAKLYFLGTNKNTAQGYHGHLVTDEYQHILKFKEFQELSSGMAMQSQYHEIYITTPSNTQHDGWKFWDGTHYNKGRKESEKIHLDVRHQALKDGRLCEDGHYRQMITVEDAVAKGCDFFDLDALKLKYSPEAYNNLLMCQPIDDTKGIFTLQQIEACMVDSWVKWLDFEPLSENPYQGNVWVGYDPSRSHDDASCVVIAPPIDSGKYRILEKHSWQNMPFADQAAEIKKIKERYNVTYMGIDISGMGQGVFELVQAFYPSASGILYDVNVKNNLVLKAMHLINKKRLEFDAGWYELAVAFMTIRQTATKTSGQITYQADRTAETGHADLAWATMHALDAIELRKLVAADESSKSSTTHESIMEL